MFLVLHGGCHLEHNHSHHISILENSSPTQNLNVRAAIIHVIGDLVQSVGVFVSSVIIKFYVSILIFSVKSSCSASFLENQLISC